MSKLASIFEVIAVNDLDALLRELFVEFFGKFDLNIKIFNLSLKNYSLHIFAGVKTLIETYFLKTYDGLIADVFYGVRRLPRDPNSHFWRFKTIFFSIYLPIIKAYLRNLKDKFADEQRYATNTHDRESFKSRLISAFLKLYPIVYAGLAAANLVASALFLLNRSSFANLALFVQQILLVKSEPTNPAELETRFSERVKRWIWFLVRSAVFFLQFYEWCRSNPDQSVWGNAAFRAQFAGSTPSPPSLPDKIGRLSTSNCPICQQPKQNLSVIGSTGVAGCHACLHQFVNANGHCPITFIACDTTDIINCFHDE